MADFLKAYREVLQNEGGYSNRAVDKGGETYCGITRKYNPSWPGWKLVDTAKPLAHGEIIAGVEMESLVRTFYRQTKWDRIKGDRIGSQWVAEFTVDWLITSDADAVKALQKAVKQKEDGVIGPVTLEAVNNADEADLKKKLVKARRLFYQDIVKKDPSQTVNIKGWMNRVDKFANAL